MRLPYGRPLPQRKFTAVESAELADTAMQVKAESVNEPDPRVRGWYWEKAR
jgi:hypothetical protein